MSRVTRECRVIFRHRRAGHPVHARLDIPQPRYAFVDNERGSNGPLDTRQLRFNEPEPASYVHLTLYILSPLVS